MKKIKLIILQVLCIMLIQPGYVEHYEENVKNSYKVPKNFMVNIQTGKNTAQIEYNNILPTSDSWWELDSVYRANLVYDTICEVGGWWGEGCPPEQDLVAWLVFEEGATLNYIDRVNMAKGIRYRFHYFGSTDMEFRTQLSGFTAFYNPNGDDYLTNDDWKALLNPSIDMSEYKDIVDEVYSSDISVKDGMYMYWWSQTEVVTAKGKWPGSYAEGPRPGGRA